MPNLKSKPTHPPAANDVDCGYDDQAVELGKREENEKRERKRQEEERKQSTAQAIAPIKKPATPKALLNLKVRHWRPGDKPPEGKQSFSGIPNYVLASPAYLSLDSATRDVLMYLRWKYRGNNNGKLSATMSELHKTWRWKHSKKKRGMAIKTLLASGLVRLARPQEKRRCAWYALPWAESQEEGK